MSNEALVHAQADLEDLRARSLRFARYLEERLATCDTALSRPVPKVEIVREVLQQLADMAHEQVTTLTNRS